MDPLTKSVSESHLSDSPIAGDRHSAEESVAEMASAFGLGLRLDPLEDDTGNNPSQSNSDIDQIASDSHKEEQKGSESEKDKQIGSQSLGDEQNNFPNPAHCILTAAEFLASFHPTQVATGQPKMSRIINPGFTQASRPVGRCTCENCENAVAPLPTRSTSFNPTYHARNADEYLESFHPGQSATNRPRMSQRTNPRHGQALGQASPPAINTQLPPTLTLPNLTVPHIYVSFQRPRHVSREDTAEYRYDQNQNRYVMYSPPSRLPPPFAFGTACQTSPPPIGYNTRRSTGPGSLPPFGTRPPGCSTRPGSPPQFAFETACQTSPPPIGYNIRRSTSPGSLPPFGNPPL